LLSQFHDRDELLQA